MEEMPAFPDRESTLLSKLYQSAPWTAKLHKTTGEESGDGVTRVTSDSVPPVNDIGQAVGEDLVSTTGTRTCYYTLINTGSLKMLSKSCFLESHIYTLIRKDSVYLSNYFHRKCIRSDDVMISSVVGVN